MFWMWAAGGCADRSPPVTDEPDDRVSDSASDTDPVVESGDSAPTAIDPCAEPGQCCAGELPPFAMCFLEGLQTTLTGTFTGWAGGVRFLASDGTEPYLTVFGSAGSLDGLPDLSLAGEVTVTQVGSCDPKGGLSNVVHVADAAGATLVVIGSTGVVNFLGWTVDAAPDVETCPGREGHCFDFLHDHPVTFTHGGASVALFPTESGTVDGYTVRVNYSWSATGAERCSDVPSSAVNWRIVGP